MRRRTTIALGIGFGVVVLAFVVVQTSAWIGIVQTGEYNRTTVQAIDENGRELGAVEVRIADTLAKQTVGLSETESLGPDEGMLFVHEEPGEYAYVMREMAFPLDIVFVAENGTVTAIHHASAPGPLTMASQLEKYTGHGTYVLEVNRGWTNETGLDVGDRIFVPELSVGSPGRCEEWNVVETADGTTERRPVVTGINADGSTLGSVTVRIADNASERFTGLSETESMGWNEGMLFIFEESNPHTFVMRRMDFPLDIVFVAENGTVTAIHHAPTPPPSGYEERYRGTGQYVLEVSRGWTNETGLDEGDRLCAPVMNATQDS